MRTVAKTLIMVTGLGLGIAATTTLLAHGYMGGNGMMNGGNGYPNTMHQGYGNGNPMMGRGMMGNNSMMQQGYGSGTQMTPGMMNNGNMNPGMMGNRGMMNYGHMSSGMMGNTGMMNNGTMGPGMMGNRGMMDYSQMGPGMMNSQGFDLTKQLAETKKQIGITEDQEAAWNAYATVVEAHIILGKANHQTMLSQQAFDPAVHNTMRQSMLESHKKVSDAYTDLTSQLTPEQLKATKKLSGKRCVG